MKLVHEYVGQVHRSWPTATATSQLGLDMAYRLLKIAMT